MCVGMVGSRKKIWGNMKYENMKICVCTYVSGGGRSLWHIILENRTKMYAFASILVAMGSETWGTNY